jgi:hypothetical protein
MFLRFPVQRMREFEIVANSDRAESFS